MIKEAPDFSGDKYVKIETLAQAIIAPSFERRLKSAENLSAKTLDHSFLIWGPLKGLIPVPNVTDLTPNNGTLGYMQEINRNQREFYRGRPVWAVFVVRSQFDNSILTPRKEDMEQYIKINGMAPRFRRTAFATIGLTAQEFNLLIIREEDEHGTTSVFQRQERVESIIKRFGKAKTQENVIAVLTDNKYRAVSISLDRKKPKVSEKQYLALSKIL